MERSLAGKVAVVTGASAGIGRSVASELASRGAAVVGLARRFSAASAAKAEPGVVTEVGLDITDVDGVEKTFANIGDVDVLVHSAGLAHFGEVLALDAPQLEAMLDVHVVGAANCTRAALPGLRRRCGTVVFIGSVVTRVAFVECSGYAAAKYAQLGYARALAAEEQASGVRVMTAVVGATDTDLWNARPGFARDRMARPGHVASVVVDLCAEDRVTIEEVVIVPHDRALARTT